MGAKEDGSCIILARRLQPHRGGGKKPRMAGNSRSQYVIDRMESLLGQICYKSKHSCIYEFVGNGA